MKIISGLAFENITHPSHVFYMTNEKWALHSQKADIFDNFRHYDYIISIRHIIIGTIITIFSQA